MISQSFKGFHSITLEISIFENYILSKDLSYQSNVFIQFENFDGYSGVFEGAESISGDPRCRKSMFFDQTLADPTRPDQTHLIELNLTIRPDLTRPGQVRSNPTRSDQIWLDLTKLNIT